MIKPKIMLLITITILGLSIGYGAFNAELSISGDASVNGPPRYKEEILNGTEPKLEDPLIAVTIEDDGTVRKAALNTEWYNYSEKRWANAVILKDESINYSVLDIIPESNIESYFVWIPKYSYKLWDLGNYTGNTTIDESKVHSIEIRFGITNTSDSVDGECTTPGISEESGNCEVGDYMTHPAFLSFNTTGMWVGKFETGYSGATTTTEAENNTIEVEKVIIKPDIYSWREIQVANAFVVSYNYKRELESHMMKNTEWGAVAYLSHSIYGINEEVRINNNSSFKTGYAATTENASESTTEVAMWNTTIGYLASTTGNITGIYDMSGGAYEYVMGVMKDENGNLLSGNSSIDNSGFNGILIDGSSVTTGIDFPESKYYDVYNYNTSRSSYFRRILGDATGEMGPFQSYKSSWYSDASWYISIMPWFYRGGSYISESGAGMFYFYYSYGAYSNVVSFRLVLSV